LTRATKPIVSMEDTFDRLDIRVGRIIKVELETSTHKPTYRMTVDFGKFGTRVSYGRFTCHPVEEVKNRLVLGVLNLEPRKLGAVVSEALILGVQFPKSESGEATFVSPLAESKIGGKFF